MGLLSKVFSSDEKEIIELLKNKATIIDVRNPGEFSRGRIENSMNIPLQQISERADEILRLENDVVFCCAAGVRSGKATSILKKQGLKCANGGSWMNVKRLLEDI
ncbi:MAG: rhodanese-like domain-containing protein [Crocinitomicaceae bacterium]